MGGIIQKVNEVKINLKVINYDINIEFMTLLAPGEIRHSGPGENRQFWPDENRQSLFTI